jgi:hypothetical protein
MDDSIYLLPRRKVKRLPERKSMYPCNLPAVGLSPERRSFTQLRWVRRLHLPKMFLSPNPFSLTDTVTPLLTLL